MKKIIKKLASIGVKKITLSDDLLQISGVLENKSVSLLFEEDILVTRGFDLNQLNDLFKNRVITGYSNGEGILELDFKFEPFNGVVHMAQFTKELDDNCCIKTRINVNDLTLEDETRGVIASVSGDKLKDLRKDSLVILTNCIDHDIFAIDIFNKKILVRK